MYGSGNDIEAFLRKRPAWFAILYPNTDEMLEQFDSRVREVARSPRGRCHLGFIFKASVAYGIVERDHP